MFDLWVGKIPGEGHGNPLQYSCLENPMDRGAWRATVHGVTRVGHELVTKPPPPPVFFSGEFQGWGPCQAIVHRSQRLRNDWATNTDVLVEIFTGLRLHRPFLEHYWNIIQTKSPCCPLTLSRSLDLIFSDLSFTFFSFDSGTITVLFPNHLSLQKTVFQLSQNCFL